MGSYKKTYSNDIFFFLPFTCSDVGSKLDLDAYQSKSVTGQQYVAALNENAAYECNNSVVHQMQRIAIGRYRLACLTDDYDGSVVGEEQADFVLTLHENSRMCILAVIVIDCKSSPTQLEDQMSSGHLEVYDKRTDAYITIAEFMRTRFKLIACGEPKCMLGMSALPEDDAEMAYILAGETYNSVHIDYRIASSDILGWRERNIAKYDYYDAYLSNKVIAFVMKDYPQDFAERIKVEATYLFIVELTAFQHSAISRTNMRIAQELDSQSCAEPSLIEALYSEFGRTIRFWDPNNFKYHLAQAEADEIAKAFDIREILGVFYRNENYLEHLIDVRGVRSSERENRILNAAVLLLTYMQVSSIVADLVGWMFSTFGWNEKYLNIADCGAMVLLFATLVLLYILLWKPDFLRRPKKR